MRYSHSFYLDLLGLLCNKFPDFYWGDDEPNLGYYWGDTNLDIHKDGFKTLQDLVDSISKHISLEL